MRSRCSRTSRPALASRTVAAAALTVIALGACSDGTDDDDGAPAGTVAVDEDFPGDALDATCARLEAGAGEDRDAIARALLSELVALGDERLTVNTLEMAVVDRCPEWADAVTAAVADVP